MDGCMHDAPGSCFMSFEVSNLLYWLAFLRLEGLDSVV